MHDQLKLENQLCFRLYSASRLITQAYHPLLSEIGLTYPQYLVMMVLWEKDGQPVNDIAKRLYLETNTVTPLLKRMEEAGLVTRQRNKCAAAERVVASHDGSTAPRGEGDGRQVLVHLTEAGRALEGRAADIPFRIGGAVTCETVNPQTVPQLFGMLDDIIDNLNG